MSDLILLSHTDLPPVILVLLAQSLRMQRKNTDTQLARAYDPLELDGFISPCHPQAVPQPLDLMEEPANRRNGAFTSQNSSLSSLDYSDLTLSLPALPPSEVRGGEDRGSAVFGMPTPYITGSDLWEGRGGLESMAV
ncbi:hypothetical protein E3U43_020103 [Larimichthys crocea]|uniref:Uncharacterized protein n=1 Tax=Larimichthys crocea TaxID=215358 RepID=A0ACD3QVD7_LARCR|nr:hypothetical protein E3U43_020103 [Larimichthys crocea]